jgi:hypothetical protein
MDPEWETGINGCSPPAQQSPNAAAAGAPRRQRAMGAMGANMVPTVPGPVWAPTLGPIR